jgi:hypothetical protein
VVGADRTLHTMYVGFLSRHQLTQQQSRRKDYFSAPIAYCAVPCPVSMNSNVLEKEVEKRHREA